MNYNFKETEDPINNCSNCINFVSYAVIKGDDTESSTIGRCDIDEYGDEVGINCVCDRFINCKSETIDLIKEFIYKKYIINQLSKIQAKIGYTKEERKVFYKIQEEINTLKLETNNLKNATKIN